MYIAILVLHNIATLELNTYWILESVPTSSTLECSKYTWYLRARVGTVYSYTCTGYRYCNISIPVAYRQQIQWSTPQPQPTTPRSQMPGIPGTNRSFRPFHATGSSVPTFSFSGWSGWIFCTGIAIDSTYRYFEYVWPYTVHVSYTCIDTRAIQCSIYGILPGSININSETYLLEYWVLSMAGADIIAIAFYLLEYYCTTMAI